MMHFGWVGECVSGCEWVGVWVVLCTEQYNTVQ